ncbi:septum site-determining protein MinC [Bacillus massilinigeriensis]|uniref:septum site-determining protein MinC n=1 Tax=Bacillus mediterraneensis TaxID=1805474 RepID=UPI0008F96073|nr:septum site-determining protein MinC [Bacillus mediterraneensis]
MKNNQNVTIKGTKDGLTLHLDDTCSYEELKKELDRKLVNTSNHHETDKMLTVKVKAGNRYLSQEQKEELKEVIRQKRNLIVDSIDTNVITMEQAEEMMRENEIVTIARIVRSGQVLEVTGDMLLVGDVNPGGTVKASGNIFILGSLKGVAHAGFTGNEKAVIAASAMRASQLRIAGYVNRAPDGIPEQEEKVMECAYITDDGQIAVDRLQALIKIRPSLTRFEGGR